MSFLSKVSWPKYKFLVIVHCWCKIILTCKKLQAAAGRHLGQAQCRWTSIHMLSNPMGCSSHVTAGTTVGIAVEIQSVGKGVPKVSILNKSTNSPVCSITSEMDCKGRLIEKPNLLNDQEIHELFEFLTSHHTTFNLDRGDTDLLDMEIHMGIESSRRVPICWISLAVQQKVAWHLQKMQYTGMI